MAIKQERLIELIAFSRNLIKKAESLIEVATHAHKIAASTDDPEKLRQVIYQLEYNVRQANLIDPREMLAFQREEILFEKNKRRNQQMADYMRRRRYNEKIGFVVEEKVVETNTELDRYFATTQEQAPPTKPRDTFLDQLTVPMVRDTLLEMQAKEAEPLTTTDIAELWRKRGGTDDEVMSWLKRLQSEGILIPGKYNGEFTVV